LERLRRKINPFCGYRYRRSLVHRLNGVVYDRSTDGDFKIKNPELISRIVAKKTAYYSELRLYPRIINFIND
jgi:hypothetical protein